MKTLLSSLAVFTLVCTLPLLCQAEVPVQSDASASRQTTTPPPQLPHGVDDVLKLSRAQISEDIILNYVRNSGTAYGLKPNEIVYLRDQGVSDRVLTTMLEQRNTVAAENPNGQAAAAGTPAQATQSTSVAAQQPAAPSPIYQPSPVYVQPAPVQVPAPSTVHVIPYPAVRYSYYNASPYYSTRYYSYPHYGYPHYGYRGYYRYPGPVFSFGLSFGGPYYRHCH